ncbi:hypothetical protein ACL02U_19865 [Streptomyces sp. MS06]|uniref:hypothetical protein n=1 Tax=Streptomyces sp. MS06 TaxID=3385974 RepID=UPI0039A25C57
MHTDHVRRAYSFVCLDCGHGWEATYDIDVSEDGRGGVLATYHLGGRLVRSPLQHPRCPDCEGRKVRIMRPGRVAGAHLHER